MSNKSIVSIFLLLFFVLLGSGSAVGCGYFYDVGGHQTLGAAFGWVSGICLAGATACLISLITALWESQ